MKDEQIYKFMEQLPEEYLDEYLQFHMQHAAEPARAHRLKLFNRLTALLRLRKTAHPYNEIDDLMREAVCNDTARRSTQNDVRISLPEQKQEDYMKTEKQARKLNKAALILIFATVLVIGGTAAAVGYSLHKHNQNSENRLENELSENETPPDLEHAVIRPKLTDQCDQAECHIFAKAQSGFYHAGSWGTEHEHTMSDGRTYITTDHHRLLRYFDEKSGKTAIVCAKPNCLHDGSEFCVATTKNYEIISQYVYLDGYVYAVALDNIEANKNPESCTRFPTVLLRYAPDGTEVTAIATLRESQYQSEGYGYGNFVVEIIAHRGQLWINLPYQELFTVKDSNMNIISGESRGGYELYCYEPEPKKLTVLATTGEPQKDYYPKSSAMMKGVGDYVYYHKVSGDWRDPVKNSGIYRIDCRTGVIEQVLNLKRDKSLYYTVSGNDIYYSFVTTSDFQDPTYTSFFKYNMKTQETTELISFFDLAKTQADWLDQEKTGYDYGRDASIDFANMIAANGCLYIPWCVNDYRKKDEAAGYNYITRFDADGNYETVDLGNAKGTDLPEEYVRSYVAKHGYWNNEDGTYIHIEPEDLTEADIQRAMKDNWLGKAGLTVASVTYDSGSFYFDEQRAVFRMTPDELFGDMNAELILTEIE